MDVKDDKHIFKLMWNKYWKQSELCVWISTDSMKRNKTTELYLFYNFYRDIFKMIYIFFIYLGIILI